MATNTSNFGFTKPGVADPVDQDIWGGQLNSNWDDTDGLIALTTISKTASFSVSSTEFNVVFLIDTSSGAVVASLPAGANVFNGFTIAFKVEDDTNTFTLDGDGSETIDGNTTVVVNGGTRVVWNGTEWNELVTNIDDLPIASTTVAGIVELGTQAEVEAETSGKVADLDALKYHPGMAKAHINFDAAGGTLSTNGFYNASAVRTAAGRYTLTITGAMANADYTVSFGGPSVTSISSVVFGYDHASPSKTTTTLKVANVRGGSYVDDDDLSVTIFGELA